MAAQRRPQDYSATKPSRPPSDIESQSMYEHWETFIRMLAERGFTDQEIGMIVGGNFLRVMRDVLPDSLERREKLQ